MMGRELPTAFGGLTDMKASAALLAVAVLAVGCSGVDAENVVDVGPEPASAPAPTQGMPANVRALKPVGMYDWDPEGGFHNAMWSGTLVIDGPCVYLDVSHQDGTPVQGEPLRSFVRLPGPLTRHDAATGELWVGDHGPMSSGEESRQSAARAGRHTGTSQAKTHRSSSMAGSASADAPPMCRSMLLR